MSEVQVTWTLVRGDTIAPEDVEPGAAGIGIPGDVLAWAQDHGLDCDDPDVYLLVGTGSQPVPGQIAVREGTVSAAEAALITAWLRQDAANRE